MITFTTKSALIPLAVVSLFSIPVFGQVIETEVQKLMPIDLESEDDFGHSVALDGDTAVIGAWFEDDSGTTNNGAAYVFTRSGGVWTEQAKLLASDKDSFDNFGQSVALDGDTAVIGASRSDDSGTTNNGAAYVFTRSGGVWTEQAKLLASDKDNRDLLGLSVALDGDTAVIGGHNEVPDGTPGVAYVFAPIGITSVEIDIKPGSLENPINLRAKKGTIPVAILTTETFDAAQVDWETVLFGPSGATERHERLHVGDTDGDGDMDAELHFRTRDTGILCDDTEATLTGETFAGDAFAGTDVIKTVKCPK
jgi:hypothetical protein